MKSLSVPERHQKNIAIKTLKMNDVMARIMGGMSKDEAREFLKSIGYTDAQVRKLEASQTSRRAFVASELLKLARELLAADVVLISDLNKGMAYFAKTRHDAKDATDRSVFDEVVKSGDTITMGKVIGTPSNLFQPSDKQALREHGIGTEFEI
jgi:hypothetical protein